MALTLKVWICIYEIHIAIIHLIIHMNMKTKDPKWLPIQLHITYSYIYRSFYYTRICKWMSFVCLVPWMKHLARICRPILDNSFKHHIVAKHIKMFYPHTLINVSHQKNSEVYFHVCLHHGVYLHQVQCYYILHKPWWRHDNGTLPILLALCERNLPVLSP